MPPELVSSPGLWRVAGDLPVLARFGRTRGGAPGLLYTGKNPDRARERAFGVRGTRGKNKTTHALPHTAGKTPTRTTRSAWY